MKNFQILKIELDFGEFAIVCKVFLEKIEN